MQEELSMTAPPAAKALPALPRALLRDAPHRHVAAVATGGAVNPVIRFRRIRYTIFISDYP
jgi:hypothetical protein